MPRCLAQNVFAPWHFLFFSFFILVLFIFTIIYVPTKNKALTLLYKAITIFRFTYLKEHLFPYKKARMLFYRLQLAIEAKKGGHRKRTSSSMKKNDKSKNYDALKPSDFLQYVGIVRRHGYWNSHFLTKLPNRIAE